MSKEIENAVSKILENAGISAVITYRGEKKNAFSEGHTMDEWQCDFQSCKTGSIVEEFEYFTGSGLRSPAPMPTDGGPRPKKSTIMWEQLEKQRKPQAPHVAGILNSLLMDSDAVGRSFENWCSEYGYDNDSRKAHAIYTACQKNADKLSRVIDRKTREALREALQDY